MRAGSPFRVPFHSFPAIQRHKERLNPTIFHCSTKAFGRGFIIPGFFKSLISADFEARFPQRPSCNHVALLGRDSMPSQLSNAVKDVSTRLFPRVLQSTLKGNILLWVFREVKRRTGFWRNPFCDHRALLGPHSTPLQLSNAVKNVSI